MFTGLVEAVGEVARAQADRRRAFACASASPLAGELSPGDSLAVNGVCLTVILRRATARFTPTSGPRRCASRRSARWRAAALVNLERPLRADGRFGGHFVQGHVDAVGRIEELRPDADFHWLTVEFPAELAPYLVHKGSIAVDGISLTVAGLGADRFDVQMVPYTLDAHEPAARAGPRPRQPRVRHGRQVRRAGRGTRGPDADASSKPDEVDDTEE